jgi:cytochrome oxidase Cu insertion factor (SCO1/SenC/PrrC family)
MNTKILFVAITIVAAFGIAAVVGLTSATHVLAQDNMTMAGNMTGGNMTGGNMTVGDNMTMGG